MALDDDTEITYSETKPDGRVKVYIEISISLRKKSKKCVDFSLLRAYYNNVTQVTPI